MRKLYVVASLLFLAATQTLFARSEHQSYISYDDGETFIVEGDGGRETESRVNLPVFAGDEIRTGRRGRVEIRLADGNVLALDRSSALRFDAIAESYESDDSQTVARLFSGQAIVHRLQYSTSPVRLDTELASYVSSRDAVFSIDSESRGADVISVFEGTVEVRTEHDSERIRAGEQAKVDEEGIYADASLARDGTTEFERWFLRRADRYDRRGGSRYLNNRFSYYESELGGYGSWIYVSDYDTWAWRPTVSVGWRPYYYGRWVYGRGGSLVWVSDEPWGWMPYHYGRWTYNVLYGWVWMPGYGYSPAWVYWAYGPSYVGWIPSGWYDCYRPYYGYGWAYRPTVDVGLGFYGRVRFGGVDLGGWTFIDSHTLLSQRADRAALTTDAIRERLTRGGDVATVSSRPARFGRDDIKDPAAAVGVIARGGAGGGTGRGGSGSLADLTSFIRRDPELPDTVRERIRRPGGGSAAEPTRAADSPRVPRGDTPGRTPSSGGSTRPEVIDRTPVRGDRGNGGSVIDRQPAPERGTRPEPTTPSTDERRPRISRPDRDADATPRSNEEWRGGVRRPRSETPAPRGDESDSRATAPRVDRGQRDSDDGTARPRTPRVNRDADATPRKVIDRIGGVRMERPERGVTPRSTDRPRSSDSPRSVDRPRSSDHPRSESRPSASPRSESRGSGGSSSTRGSGSSGSSNSGSSGSRSSSNSSGSGRSNIKRD